MLERLLFAIFAKKYRTLRRDFPHLLRVTLWQVRFCVPAFVTVCEVEGNLGVGWLLLCCGYILATGRPGGAMQGEVWFTG